MSQSTAASELQLLDRYWRAANYLSVGQIYLMANPLLRAPEPDYSPARPESYLYLRAGPRRAGHGGEYLAGR